MTTGEIRLTEDVALRPVRLTDAAAFARAYKRNFDHLERWDPIRPDEFYTEAGQYSRLRNFDQQRGAGQAERWVFDRGDDEVYGSVTLSNIELGIFLNARMGYWVDVALIGKGLATAAVDAVCDHARQRWNLHRVEAGTNVENVASQRVLAKCGFEEMGVSRSHLYINGRWADSKQFYRILHTDEISR
ncbi:GNAT family N-acetyltransferase [Catenulispora sp. NL8]|uniref:GNAT family N-acetyltransferase n=1 Tax=Catenulispora pinistramenti TaxID=2705254 RepID=A0ABS5L2V2_9ACTN|nr:GNAT family protein [Catenulispora pinistramenti]MBS2552653.1 GNAT family N-acetyltransferase [Catenulispora pinistramenti]